MPTRFREQEDIMTDAPDGAMRVPEDHRSFCPRCGKQTERDARAGVVVAIACEECGHEFTVARPDEEMASDQTAINADVSS
jgi:uncharacterized protein (DUF983 family)